MPFYKQPIRPYDPVIEYDSPETPVRYLRSEFNGAGQYSYPQPPNEPQDQFSELLNVMPPLNGSFVKRWGTVTRSGFTDTGTWIARRAAVYANEAAVPVTKKSVWMGTTGGVPSIRAFDDAQALWAKIPITASAVDIHMAYSRSTAYFTDGFDSGIKWDGSIGSPNAPVSKWGIVSPVVAPTIASLSSGLVTLVSGRGYFYVFRNSTTGHMSDLSPFSVVGSPAAPGTTGPITNQEIHLSNIQSAPSPADSQVDKIWILATADGGDETLLYFVAEINIGTTTYIDNTPELTLLNNNVVQETDINGNLIGVADNTPPPTAGQLTIKHQGRIFISKNAVLYCSKNLQELTTSTGLIAGKFEEAWPFTNQFDLSDNAEVITSLVSDGITLYIGTPQHIYRLNGDSPVDFQFQQIAFNEAGVVQQDAIDVVYANGNPSGCVWMTPDRRIIHSDFNTYSEIGGPIQDLLNRIPDGNLPYVHTTFYSRGEYDLCTVQFSTNPGAVTSNIFWAVFEMKSGTWVVWEMPAGTLASLLYFTAQGLPQWLFFDADATHQIQWLDPSLASDNNQLIFSAITTPYYHFGTPTERKWLNELEILTTDININVSISAATTAADFAGPLIIVNRSPVVSPLGPLKIFTAGDFGGGYHRFFRTRFTTTTGLPSSVNWIEAFNFEIIPIHKL